MFAGHFAPALALKRAAPSVPLWALLVAGQAVDFGFIVLVFLGVESADVRPGEHPPFVVTHGVWTHSLAMTAVYGLAIASIGGLLGRRREALVIAAAVCSHWVGDLLVHAPDLPLAFDQSDAVGFGLWRVPIAAWALECGLIIVAALWLARGEHVRRRRLRSLAIGLCVAQTIADFVSPLPETAVELGLVQLPVFFAVAAVGWWVERPMRKRDE